MKMNRTRHARDLSTLSAVGSSERQSAMHERYPGLNLYNARRLTQPHRRCPRITRSARHLTRADLARRSATIFCIRTAARSDLWACSELPAVAVNQWGTQGTTAAIARSDDAGAAPCSAPKTLKASAPPSRKDGRESGRACAQWSASRVTFCACALLWVHGTATKQNYKVATAPWPV